MMAAGGFHPNKPPPPPTLPTPTQNGATGQVRSKMTKNSTFTKGQGRQTKRDQGQLLHLPWALFILASPKGHDTGGLAGLGPPSREFHPCPQRRSHPKSQAPPQEFPRNRPLTTESRCQGNQSLNNFGISTTFD